MREPVYEVFARKTRAEPLHHIGYVNGLSAELARVCAWKTYDEQNWFEMCLVPRDAIIPVNRSEGPYAAGADDAGREIVRSVATGSYGGEEMAVREGKH